MKVAKFGGSSVATAEKVRQVCEIIASDPERRIVVVSAPGKRSRADAKVTDLLIDCAEARLASRETALELKRVVQRFEEISEGLGLNAGLMEGIGRDLEERSRLETSDPACFVDAMKAGGEDNCARLVAAALAERGVAAEYVNPGDAGLLMSDEPGDAQVLSEAYERLSELGDRDGVIVFPGFYGYTKSGEIATFARGGSDMTGAVLAAAVGAELYENFTDVDAVHAAAPDIVPDAKPIRQLSYREMRELSYAGFEVFQSEALIPLIMAGVPMRILSTERPEGPGTTISSETAGAGERVKGIAAQDGFCTILIQKYLMNREIGFGRRVLGILREYEIRFEHMPSGVDDLSVIIPSEQASEEVLGQIVERIRDELGADEVRVEGDLALIAVVGEGMRHTPGIAARITEALAASGVNISTLHQGASETSVTIGVHSDDLHSGVNAIYREFFGE